MPSVVDVIANFKNKRIIVIGDLMLDHYIHGDVTRISPEAPVPVLNKLRDEYVLGGAGNVATNLQSLGALVSIYGVVGADAEGAKIIELLEQNTINATGVVRENNRPTTLKQRFIAGHYQLLRLDNESKDALAATTVASVLAGLREEIPLVDAVVISDYAKGVFTQDFSQQIIQLAKEYAKPVIADFKPRNKSFFKGVDILTPNLKEAREMSGRDGREEAALALATEFAATAVVTLSADGVIVADLNGVLTYIPSRKIKVHDVSGAGDTVTAVVALAVVSSGSAVEAATLANYAGELVVQKPGTATVSAEELISRSTQDQHTSEVGVVSKLWGYEKWLENNDHYCSKLLVINKGYQCSLHYHKIKDEMFLVTKGHVRTELDNEVLHMKPGNFIRVTPGVKHRFLGLEDSEMLEISTHHDEADSYRIEESKKVDTDKIKI